MFGLVSLQPVVTRHPGSLALLWAKEGTLGDKEEERPESEERNTWSSRRMRYLRLISAVLGIRADDMGP